MRTESLTRIFLTFVFFDLYFDSLLIVPCRTRGISYGFHVKKKHEYYFLNTNLSHESFLLVYLSTRLLLKIYAFAGRNDGFVGSIAMRYCQYTYAALSVHLCCTFGARVLHFYWNYYSKVFTVAFLSAKLDKSRGHLTIIHTRICFFRTLIGRI